MMITTTTLGEGKRFVSELFRQSLDLDGCSFEVYVMI